MQNGIPTEKPELSMQNGSFVIVIGRQFGSGGRKIGKLVSKRLGYEYYDKELLAEAAQSLGFSQDIFAAHDERKPSPLKSLLQGIYGIADNFHDTSICGESLYHAQSEVIKKICEKGSCVIVGRTADYVLRHHPGLISVFLHAPIEKRARQIVGRGDAPDLDSATDMAKKNDRKRESYYNYYTGGGWGKASSYHLSIDASSIRDEDIVDMIISFANAKKRHG
ncbi:MAG: cytidylate kinase-like family protein [Muribaculaceae bacterium]|nr:cytidylate kinase-like family protein [Muribaculaceae bacterium]